jgi:hypothetical protein
MKRLSLAKLCPFRARQADPQRRYVERSTARGDRPFCTKPDRLALAIGIPSN